MLLAIDPGTTQSALVCWNGKRILGAGIVENKLALIPVAGVENVVIEQVRSYGMPVGKDVFDTVFWSGRFCQVYEAQGIHVDLVPRLDVKLYLCHNSRAKDSNISQALRDRFGPKPTKKNPNPVYGDAKIVRDLWQAWALSVYFWDVFIGCGVR